MNTMPEQILFDILLWLPVASLLRFKMVCKSWFNLIESSTFVNQHLDHRSGEDTLIISHSRSRHLGFCLFSGNKYELCTDIDFDDLFITTIRDYFGIVDMVDSCDGIICLQNGWYGDVALWNPALNQLRLLPKSTICDQHCKTGYVIQTVQHIGFGFDATANDYKVVRIIWRTDMLEVHQVEIYNLRNSFSWRIIDKNGVLPFTCLFTCANHATSKNGTCFWVGLCDKNNSMIVSFDLKDEVFETMSLPPDCQEIESFGLDFLNEKLAYIRGLNPRPSDNDCFEIWVLNEFGVKESWNKIYNIYPTPNLGTVGLFATGFSKNGKFFLLKGTSLPSGLGELYLRNLVTGEEREESYFPAQKPNPHNLQFFLHYNESLVSLRGGANGEG